MDRSLATIKRIDEIRPIEGADAIECAIVGGWATVVKKGEFNVGALAVYCEIDSWIPDHIAPFLSKGRAPRVYEGIPGERLRTVKLRGTTSQGLLLPMHVLTNYGADLVEGADVTEVLGIVKYEAPIPANLSGQVSGSFPTYIPKTDQERIQNLKWDLVEWQGKGYSWEESEKLDGTSATFFRSADKAFGACSRNWEITETEGNTYWVIAHAYNLPAVLADAGNFAIQGEIIGPGVQKNKYQLAKHEFRVYDIFDIDAQKYLTSAERNAFAQKHGLPHVPVNPDLTKLDGMTVESLLTYAEGKSLVGKAKPEREGVVFKCVEHPEISFKAISNRFLLENDE